MLSVLAFYLFSAVTLFSAVMVITARNPVHSVLFLILSFFSTAGLFILLGAEFLAMLLVVVYVGAIAVLFLFVVMLLDIPIPSAKSWFIPKTRSLFIALARLGAYVAILFGITYLFIASVFYGLSVALDMTIMNLTDFIQNPVLELLSLLRQLFDQTLGVGLISLGIPFIGFMLARQLAIKLLQDSFLSLCQAFVHQSPVGLIIVGALIVELVFVVMTWGETAIETKITLLPSPADQITQNTFALGENLYTGYLYIFQTAGLILLVAMIAAIILTQRRRPWVLRQNIGDQVNRHRHDAVELRKVNVGEGVTKWS